MQDHKPIGIVIPTHNRYKQLRQLLASIRDHWTDLIDSVIVVDDSTEPQDLNSEFGKIDLRQIVLKNRAFISRAKNIGWQNTEADYVYFIDDDNVIDNSTILPPFQLISKLPRIAALMPAVVYKNRPDLVWVYSTPLAEGHLKLRLVGRNLPRNSGLESRLLKTDALPNASIIRKNALEDVEGFDEQLVVNSSMDLSLRMKARGWQVYSYTGAFVFHDVEPPGQFGWWATHGAADPERVRYEIRDWFTIMRRLRRGQRLFALRAIVESRFIVPNLFAYMTRGHYRSTLTRSLLTGYFEGLLDSGHSLNPPSKDHISSYGNYPGYKGSTNENIP